MWRAIGCHAALVDHGLDPWLARMVAELLWRGRPVPRYVQAAAAGDGGDAVRRALALALHLVEAVRDAIGTALAIKAVGTTDHGDAWASIVDDGGRVVTIRVTETTEAVINLTAALRAR
jgi:hypothetical protein